MARSTQAAVTVTDALATTGLIPYGASYGLFTVESGDSVTSLTWYASADGINYEAAQDDDGAIVQTVAVSKAYRIPMAIAGAKYLKPVGDAAATLSVNTKNYSPKYGSVGRGEVSLPTGNLILNAPASSNAYTGGDRTFNGTTQYLSRAAHASHNLATGDAVLSGMVQRAAAGNLAICGKYQDASNYWKLEFDAANKVHFIAVIATVTLIEITSTTAITSTTDWNHIAVLIDRSAASGCKIYVNNSDDTAAGAVTSASTINNTGAFQLGADGNGALFFSGSLATFGIAKPTDVTTITTAAVLSLYNYRNGKTYNNITAAERTAWNLTSYYDLGEVSGNAIERVGSPGIDLTDNGSVTAGNGPAEAIAQDESANANHGQLVGFTAAQQITAWSPDVPAVPDCADGYGLTLDGSDDVVDCGGGYVATTAITISLWAKTAGFGNNDVLVSRRDSSGGDRSNYTINQGSTGKLHFFFTATAGVYHEFASTDTLSTLGAFDGLWHHYALSFTYGTGSSLALYLDGVAVPGAWTSGTGNASHTSVSTEKLGIGSTWSGSAWANFAAGVFDDVRIYSSALTAPQVLALASGDPTAANYPSSATLVRHWKLDDGAQANPLTGDPILGHRSSVGDWYFLQETISKRPLYDSSEMNGRPTIEFNGTSHVLYSTQISKATQQGCYSFAVTPVAIGNTMCLFALTDTTGATDYVLFGINSAGKALFQSKLGGVTTTITGGTILVAAERVILQFWSDGSTSAIAVNGVDETLGVAGGGSNSGQFFADVISPDNWCLGALKANTDTLHFEGDVGQYIGYDDETTVGKRARMYRYLKKLYGIGA